MVGHLNPQRWLLQRIRALTGHEGSPDAFREPVGDPGWFGPDAMCWQVHAHFVAMMAGGLGSLLIQSLHPRALGAVWDHSNFRQDLMGRLGRTAYFIAATTYGSRALAQSVVDRVNQIHDRISGTLPDGTPYHARDPELIEWVHLGEVLSFIRAYQHLSFHPMSPAQVNQYLREMAVVGQALGARQLPLTEAELTDQLHQRLGELRRDERTTTTHHWIAELPQASPQPVLMGQLVQLSVDLLPDWAKPWINLPSQSTMGAGLRRWGFKALGAGIQPVLMREGVAGVAHARVQGH